MCSAGPAHALLHANLPERQVNDGEPIECLTDEVKDAIMKNIRRRMTPQPVKIRADVELTCFSYDGILHIQVHMLASLPSDVCCTSSMEDILMQAAWLPTRQQLGVSLQDAMRAAQAESSDDCEVKMKLVAPPLYVLTTYTLDKAKVGSWSVSCHSLPSYDIFW